MNLGKTIRLFRTQLSMNQGELASKTGLSTSYVSLLECNKRDPTISTIESIAHALNVPLIVLIFTASDASEIKCLGTDVCEKLALLVFTINNSKK